MSNTPTTPTPIVPNCGQDRKGDPKDMIRLEQLACVRCDRYFIVSQLRHEAQPQFDDITAGGEAVTHCPGCGLPLSLSTVYDAQLHERQSEQWWGRRSEDHDAMLVECDRTIHVLEQTAALWNVYVWEARSTARLENKQPTQAASKVG